MGDVDLAPVVGLAIGAGGREREQGLPGAAVGEVFALGLLLAAINVVAVEAPSMVPPKLCTFVKPVASVLTAKMTPRFEMPPDPAVPYSVLPNKITPPTG